jgi:hypothetical protein
MVLNRDVKLQVDTHSGNSVVVLALGSVTLQILMTIEWFTDQSGQR